MVKLKLKVGQKGHVLIPKLFSDKYGIREGEEVSVEPREERLPLKGRPSTEVALTAGTHFKIETLEHQRFVDFASLVLRI